MTANNEKDITALKKVGEIVAEAREAMLAAVKPGITTLELDEIAARVLEKYGARSAPKCQYNFPGYTCISLNDVAAHGIPGSREIREGDLVNVDVSAELDGYFGDTGATVVVLPAPDVKTKLCACSRAALAAAIETVKAGAKINLIGKAIETKALSCGFNVIRNLTGHGIGHKLHEAPFNVLSYYRPDDNSRLRDGMVVAIEGFVSTRAQFVKQDADGWTLRTPDKSFVAQFEHTVLVTKGKPVILTAL